MDELQNIVEKLKEKHKEGKYSYFSTTQFHCWKSTIQLGYDDSYEHPTNKPFFGTAKTAVLILDYIHLGCVSSKGLSAVINLQSGTS